MRACRLILLIILAGSVLGCLPTELDDAALAGYCNTVADCKKKDDFACWEDVTCSANRCAKQASAKPVLPVHGVCVTPSCPTGSNCHCGAPESANKGKCLK